MQIRLTRYRLFYLFLTVMLLLSTALQAAGYQQITNTTRFHPGGAINFIQPLDSQRALLAAYGKGIILADFSQPQHPKIIHTAGFSMQAEAIALASDQRHIYIANGSAGLDILRLNGAGGMQLLGRMDTPSYAFDVALSPDGQTAFVADNSNGVMIIDVRQPAQPRLLSTINSRAAVAGVLLSRDGRSLFIADQAEGIQIMNISNLRRPQKLAQIATRGHAQRLALSADGRHLFSANNTGGLQIFMLDHLHQPRLLGELKTENAFAVNLTQNNHYALVADLFRGIKIIDVRNPREPRLLRSIQTIGQAQQVISFPEQNTLLVAEGKKGLTVLSFR